LYGEKGAELKAHLPEQLRQKVIKLFNCNEVIENDSIVIENINAIIREHGIRLAIRFSIIKERSWS
ncbi:MAG: hypothetical protein MUP41_14800, partial [Desulfobacterales bacterium]|nr:hypothetical protein [Desulfobacterales bacterium]